MFKSILSLSFVVVACGAFAQAAPGKAAAAPASPAEDATAFMKRVSDKVSGHTTAKGSLQLKGADPKQEMDITFSVMKPNFLTLVMPEFELHSSGADTLMYSPQEKMYVKLTPDMEKQGSPTSLLIGLEGLFAAATTPFQPQGKVKPGFFRGEKAIVVQLSGAGSEPIVLYVDVDTLAPIAFTSTDGKNTAVYKDLVFDAPMKAEDFAWTPPADAKTMPTPGSAAGAPPAGSGAGAPPAAAGGGAGAPPATGGGGR